MSPYSKRPMWLAWAAMVVFLLTNLSPTGGLVLCIGQDGHVAIEAATAEADCSDCLPEVTPAESCCTAPEQGLEHEGCVCSDIPLVASTTGVESIAPSKKGTANAPPAQLLAGADLGLLAPLARGLDLRGRGQIAPRPRVSVLLALRI